MVLLSIVALTIIIFMIEDYSWRYKRDKVLIIQNSCKTVVQKLHKNLLQLKKIVNIEENKPSFVAFVYSYTPDTVCR